MRRSWAGRPA
ncbi:unnamed protein product [Linum tenue]|uniref:Uncharacterized protein n=1 Tax=Linum tenue TaxID=586396 RepID=A0AAV0P2V6_9ROSI|nr:unnamed protein product [Linum tenue]